MAETTKLQLSIRILWALARKRHVTVNELYEMFDGEITKRTIQRTIKDISSTNIPISSVSGPHNEQRYTIDRAFEHIPLLLSVDEMLAALLLSQFAGMFEGTRIGEDIRAVFLKLEQLLPAESIVKSSAFSGGDYALLHQPGAAQLANYPDSLQSVFQAIITNCVCRVHYGNKHYLFHPYSLLIHNGSLYVVGKHPKYGSIIYLTVNRLKKVEILEHTFVRDADFDLRKFLAGNFGIWFEEPVDVVLRFDATVRPSIEHRVWHASQRIDEGTDGGILLRMRVGPSLELVAWILRWGAHVEVLEPASLREKIRSTASAMAKLHKKASVRGTAAS